MHTLPKTYSYGEYSSNNYGVNSLMVSFPVGLTLYYSYNTIIAFSGRDGRKVRENDWSSTTGKHLNWIDGGGGAKKNRIAGEEFETLLRAELAHYGLVEKELKAELERYEKLWDMAIARLLDRMDLTVIDELEDDERAEFSKLHRIIFDECADCHEKVCECESNK